MAKPDKAPEILGILPLQEVVWRTAAARLAEWSERIAARPSLRTTAPE